MLLTRAAQVFPGLLGSQPGLVRILLPQRFEDDPHRLVILGFDEAAGRLNEVFLGVALIGKDRRAVLGELPAQLL